MYERKTRKEIIIKNKKEVIEEEEEIKRDTNAVTHFKTYTRMIHKRRHYSN